MKKVSANNILTVHNEQLSFQVQLLTNNLQKNCIVATV